MPLIVNLGLTKKQGLPDYGSIGASCSLTIELDQSLLDRDLVEFQERVRSAYVACNQAVNEELARQHAPPAEQPQQVASQHGNGNGDNGHGGSRTAAASDKQRSYIQQLTHQIPGLHAGHLEPLSQQMFGKSLGELNNLDASALIDQLKAAKSGQLALSAIVGEGATP